MRLLLILVVGGAAMMAVGFGLTWLSGLLYRPQHDAGRLRVELPGLAETVPYRPVQGRPPWDWDRPYDPRVDGGWVSGASAWGPGEGWRHYDTLTDQVWADRNAGRFDSALPPEGGQLPTLAASAVPPEVPRLDVHHDEYLPGEGEGTAFMGAVPAGAGRPSPPSAVPVPALQVDAREGPAVAAWLRVAAHSDGVAAWFARELAAA